MFNSRITKLCAIPKLVSAPLYPIPFVEHHVGTVTDKVYEEERKCNALKHS